MPQGPDPGRRLHGYDYTVGVQEFTEQDRADQLRGLSSECRKLSWLFEQNGEGTIAVGFLDMAEAADDLLQTGWTQGDLNALSARFPRVPAWLSPKALDYDSPRVPWQKEVAEVYERATNLNLLLRVIAEYDAD